MMHERRGKYEKYILNNQSNIKWDSDDANRPIRRSVLHLTGSEEPQIIPKLCHFPFKGV